MEPSDKQSVDSSDPTGDKGDEVVKAREFDLTKYTKWAAGLFGVMAPAIFAVLNSAGVKDVTPAIVIAALGVTAVALFSASLVMAADMVSRAFVTRSQTPDQPPPAKNGATPEHSGLEVRLENSEDFLPVLRIRGKNDGDSSFLIPTGASLGDPPAFDGPLSWVPAKQVRACRVSQR